CDSPRRALANNREPKGSCRQQFRAGKVNLNEVSIFQRSLCRRVAKMRLVRRVRSSVIEHRIERCSQRLEFYNPGKQCAVTDFGLDQECRALRDLKGMKFRRRSGIVPIRVEHKWRTHHHSAAPIEPLLLLPRSWQAIRIHQRDLPLKLHAAVITLLQFRPRWLRPKTPG